MGSFLLLVTMRVILALVLFVAVASAVPQSTCEQKNKALKTAVFNLSKRSKVDCNDCYNDILAAATECILSFDWKNCIEDILGGEVIALNAFVKSLETSETFL